MQKNGHCQSAWTCQHTVKPTLERREDSLDCILGYSSRVATLQAPDQTILSASCTLLAAFAVGDIRSKR